MNILRSRPEMPEIVRTPRLMLRKWQEADALAMHEAVLLSHHHLLPWLPWMKDEPRSLEERKAQVEVWNVRYREKVDYTMGIFDRHSGKVVGGTGLHHRGRSDCTEIGYWIRVDQQGQGYVFEAANALVKVALGYLAYPRLEIRCDPRNRPSSRIPEKLGLLLEGTLRQTYRDGEGIMRDTEVWSLLESEYTKWPRRALEVEVRGHDGNWRFLK